MGRFQDYVGKWKSGVNPVAIHTYVSLIATHTTKLKPVNKFFICDNTIHKTLKHRDPAV